MNFNPLRDIISRIWIFNALTAKKEVETVIVKFPLLYVISRIWIFNALTAKKQMETVIVKFPPLYDVLAEYKSSTPYSYCKISDNYFTVMANSKHLIKIQ